MSEQMVDHKEPNNPYAIIQAENTAMMEHIVKLQLVMDVQLKALRQQEAEIAALRGFAKSMREYQDNVIRAAVIRECMAFKLIDKSGNPTALLTGANETADGQASA